MPEKKVRRPVSDIIKEKIDWLEKQCREKNNDRMAKFPGDRDASNQAFGKAIDRLNGLRDYLFDLGLSERPPYSNEKVSDTPPDNSNE